MNRMKRRQTAHGCLAVLHYQGIFLEVLVGNLELAAGAHTRTTEVVGVLFEESPDQVERVESSLAYEVLVVVARGSRHRRTMASILDPYALLKD